MTRVTPAGITTPALSLLDKVKKAFFVLAGVVVLIAILWGAYAGVKSWNSAPSRATVPSATNQQALPQFAVRSGECPGVVTPIQLDSNWKVINPGGKCRIIHRFTGLPVEFSEPSALGTSQRTFQASGHTAGVPDRVRSTGGTVNSYYSLCPLSSGVVPLNWDCTVLR